MTPKYQHDCQQCEFLGHFFDHDVYVCSNLSRSVIARYGDDGPEYTSGPAREWIAQLNETERRWHVGDERLLFREIVFSERPEGLALRAMVLAFALRGLNTLT